MTPASLIRRTAPARPRRRRPQGGAQRKTQGSDEDDTQQQVKLHPHRHAIQQIRALRTIVTLTRRFKRGGSRATDPGSTGAPSSHTRSPSVSTHPSPRHGSNACRPSSLTVSHTAQPDPPMCPAHRSSSSSDQAPMTSSSPPCGSVRARCAASSEDCRSRSAADCQRSSTDEAASAVQNVAAALFFLLFVAIEEKKNKD